MHFYLQKCILVNGIDQIKDLWNPAFKPWLPEAEKDTPVRLLKVSLSPIEFWDGGSNEIVASSNKGAANKKRQSSPGIFN